jgi:hypothetical protein
MVVLARCDDERVVKSWRNSSLQPLRQRGRLRRGWRSPATSGSVVGSGRFGLPVRWRGRRQVMGARTYQMLSPFRTSRVTGLEQDGPTATTTFSGPWTQWQAGWRDTVLQDAVATSGVWQDRGCRPADVGSRNPSCDCGAGLVDQLGCWLPLVVETGEEPFLSGLPEPGPRPVGQSCSTDECAERARPARPPPYGTVQWVAPYPPRRPAPEASRLCAGSSGLVREDRPGGLGDNPGLERGGMGVGDCAVGGVGGQPGERLAGEPAGILALTGGDDNLAACRRDAPTCACL